MRRPRRPESDDADRTAGACVRLRSADEGDRRSVPIDCLQLGRGMSMGDALFSSGFDAERPQLKLEPQGIQKKLTIQSTRLVSAIVGSRRGRGNHPEVTAFRSTI